MTAKLRAAASAKTSPSTGRRAASKGKAATEAAPAKQPRKRSAKSRSVEKATTPAATAPVAPPIPAAAPPEPTQAIVVPEAVVVPEAAAKGRRRGLGAQSKHALQPVSAPLTLVTRARSRPPTELAAVRVPAALPDDAVHYLRSELAALLALLEEPSP
ncbi:MAG: hypothetical protein JNM83_01180 [Myxococcales bacterium]|nr:hypothetical protein [Myxococcales bacterium]